MMIYPLWQLEQYVYLLQLAGTFFVRLGPTKNIMGALYKGFIVTDYFIFDNFISNYWQNNWFREYLFFFKYEI